MDAHRGLKVPNLVDMLEGRVPRGTFPPDPVDEERESMMYMKEEWKDIYDQLRCSEQHFACWDCPAGRVVHCVVLNCEQDIRSKVKVGMVKNNGR